MGVSQIPRLKCPEVSTTAVCIPQIPMSMIRSEYELGRRLTMFVMQKIDYVCDAIFLSVR
jgi:hypothetical protein